MNCIYLILVLFLPSYIDVFICKADISDIFDMRQKIHSFLISNTIHLLLKKLCN